MKIAQFTKIKSATLTDVFDAAKEKFIEKGLSMDEIAINTNVPEELLAILFDNSNNIVNDLSRVIEFSSVEMHFRLTDFDSYRFKAIEGGSKFRVWREIKPKCMIVYDNADGNLYNFKSDVELSDEYRQIIINDFYDFCTKYINV